MDKTTHQNRTFISQYIEECLQFLLNRNYSRKTIAAYENGMVRFGGYLESIGVGRIQDVVSYRYRLAYEGQGKAGDKFMLGLTDVEDLNEK